MITNPFLVPERLKSSTFSWDAEDPLRLLESLQGQPRWAWIDPNETIIAWGRAAAIQGTGLETQLNQLSYDLPGDGVRLFGGLPFDEREDIDPLWGDFAQPNFILPRYIYRQTDHDSNLTVISSDQNTPEIPFFDSEIRNASYLNDARVERMLNYPQWESMVTTARRQVSAGHIQKVVFARALKITFERKPTLVTAFSRLVERYSGTYRFYFEPHPGHVFLGATPELLLQVDGRRLETIALAGSAPRGQTSEEDYRLGSDLLADPKNRREQAIVVERICSDLRPLCDSFQLPKEPRLYQMPNIQHLETRIKAYLKNPGILSPAKALHPTPALAGQPRQAALDMIRQYEPVLRGGYGAPVGWLTPGGNGRLAVAIRSGIFRGRQGRLYAGSGLLAESQPEKEWAETTLKFRPMLEALGLSEEPF